MYPAMARSGSVSDKVKNWIENWKTVTTTVTLGLTCISILVARITWNVTIDSKVAAIEKEIIQARVERSGLSTSVNGLTVETAKVAVLLAELKQDLREMRAERRGGP